MKQTVIRRNDCAVNDWAGGRTIQLVIYPPEAEYKARNFQFRLSTATSTLDGVAPFTMLPGIDRHLLILDGEMKVYHQGHYDIELHPYQEIDHFDGGWETSSEGKVRDFNLMLGEGCTGGLSVIFQSGAKTLGEKDTHAAFFCAEGSAVITTESGSAELGREDLLLLDEIGDARQVQVQLSEGAKVVCADIVCG